jgi:hypothetical protein
MREEEEYDKVEKNVKDAYAQEHGGKLAPFMAR